MNSVQLRLSKCYMPQNAEQPINSRQHATKLYSSRGKQLSAAPDSPRLNSNVSVEDLPHKTYFQDGREKERNFANFQKLHSVGLSAKK